MSEWFGLYFFISKNGFWCFDVLIKIKVIIFSFKIKKNKNLLIMTKVDMFAKL